MIRPRYVNGRRIRRVSNGNKIPQKTKSAQASNVHQTDVPIEPQMDVNPASSETSPNKWYGNAAMIGGGALGGGILSSMMEDDEVQELILKLQRGEPLTYSEERLLRLLQES